MPNTASPNALPKTVTWAGALVTLQGLVAAGFAIVAVIRGATGHDQSVTNGYGFAAWVAILGGAVLAAGIALLTGRRWGGRGNRRRRSAAAPAGRLVAPDRFASGAARHRSGCRRSRRSGLPVLGSDVSMDGSGVRSVRRRGVAGRRTPGRDRRAAGQVGRNAYPASVLLSFGGESSEVGAGQAIRGPLRLRVGTE